MSAVVGALSCPEIQSWTGSMDIDTHVRSALSRDRKGTGITFICTEEHSRIVGRVGISEYPGIPGAVQTSTFLHPSVWGRGLNRLGKLVQIELARLAGADLYASVSLANKRSIRALRSAFPGATEQVVYEPWHPRPAFLFKIDRDPEPVEPLSDAERATVTAATLGFPMRESALARRFRRLGGSSRR